MLPIEGLLCLLETVSSKTGLAPNMYRLLINHEEGAVDGLCMC